MRIHLRQHVLQVVCMGTILAVGQSPVLGQRPNLPIRAPVEITDIIVREVPGGLQIELKANGSLSAPKTLQLPSPSRMVLDFPGAIPALSSSRIAVNIQHVARVRTALFSGTRQNNPVTRVVLDMDGPVNYRMESRGETFAIVIDDGGKGSRPVRTRSDQSTVKTIVSKARDSIQNQKAGRNQIRRIDVSATSVILLFDKVPSTRPEYLKNPHRVVLDFTNTVYAPEWRQPGKIVVNSSEIVSVRNALFRTNPMVVRVVVDRTNALAPKISSEENKLILQFEANPRSGEAKSPATAIVPASPLQSLPKPPFRTPIVPTRSSAEPEFKIPDQTWASPPLVTYEDGLLTLEAKNSRLVDVLFGIARKTGATIEVPDVQDMTDYIVVKIGPAPPSDVIATILQGTPYNYYIVENSDGDLQKVILTRK